MIWEQIQGTSQDHFHFNTKVKARVTEGPLACDAATSAMVVWEAGGASRPSLGKLNRGSR